jgi:hypothetical protein
VLSQFHLIIERSANLPPTHQQLQQYGEVFCEVIGSVYKTVGAAEPAHRIGSVCYPFYFGEQKAELDLKFLEELFREKMGGDLPPKGLVLIYHGNGLFIFKPDRLKFWLRSSAVRDADEVFADLVQKGY